MIKPYNQDNHNTLYCLDFRKNELPDECVQMVVTSPPYWGLRKYSGVPDLVWGDRNCGHKWDIPTMATLGFNTLFRPEGETSTPLGLPSDTGKYAETVKGGADRQRREQVASFCSLCGAWKGSYGLEPTPEMYIQHTIEILREIRRVLRKDGVVFWNIGDSYWGGGNNRGNLSPISDKQASNQGAVGQLAEHQKNIGKHNTLKPKDLCLIPFRVAIAAQEDGWYVRSVIIWSKPNPMPESVTDRPTESHEYILMMTKSAKYYWDADAVREGEQVYTRKASGYNQEGQKRVDGSQPYRGGGFADTDTTTVGRNIRSVWEFPTQPYPEAHFAVFPEKLPETCIKAATPEVGCCSKCGAPWERMIETQVRYRRQKSETEKYPVKPIDGYPGIDRRFDHEYEADRQTLGWQPTCKCNADKVPSIVLDPFGGAGTTPWVAKKLGRRCYVYELSQEYCELIVERNRQQVFDLSMGSKT